MGECGVVEDEHVGKRGANKVYDQTKKPIPLNAYHVIAVDGVWVGRSHHDIRYNVNP